MTNNPLVLQLLNLLHATSDLMVAAEAADLISADCRFNVWFPETAKPTKTDDELLDICDVYEQLSDEVLRALASHSSREDLIHTLHVATERLRAIARP